jgi:hypothetical protein
VYQRIERITGRSLVSPQLSLNYIDAQTIQRRKKLTEIKGRRLIQYGIKNSFSRTVLSKFLILIQIPFVGWIYSHTKIAMHCKYAKKGRRISRGLYIDFDSGLFLHSFFLFFENSINNCNGYNIYYSRTELSLFRNERAIQPHLYRTNRHSHTNFEITYTQCSMN